jgi:hypothetical protein
VVVTHTAIIIPEHCIYVELIVGLSLQSQCR